MLDKVTAYIEEHQLLPGQGEIIVAVSGGADSLCLLHLLYRLCGAGKRYPAVRLHVAHLNHKLRGEAGAQDAAAVAAIVASWGLPFTLREVDVPALARQERRSLEDAARTARYRFLREVAHGQSIAVAHHADDAVETLLLHLLRGGGLLGMVGMLPRQQDIIRPLLKVSHAETLAYCNEHSIIPLEDASNTDPRFLRNRIRHELLPLLESLNPGIRRTLLRNAAAMHVDLEWIEAQIDVCWPTVVIGEKANTIRLNLRALLALPLSLRRHMLRRITARLYNGQSPLELRHYILIEELLEQHDRKERILHLPQRLQIASYLNEVVFERLHEYAANSTLSQVGKSIRLPIPGQVEVPETPWIATAVDLPNELEESIKLALQHEDWSEVWRLLPSTRHTVYLDRDKIDACFWIRTRRPGDRIRPLGMTHEKKVQDVLVDNHIPRTERASIPLFFSTSHCVWLAGICLDDRVRLTAKTQHIVRLSIEAR